MPDYPRTQHLPFKPNATKGDLIVSDKEAKIIFVSDLVEVTEKVDGANCAISVNNGHPIIRNRNHILGKGFIARKTPAKMQFSGIFNWYYDNQDKFDKINELAGGTMGVYGEWLVAVHGIKYDKLPSCFMPFEIYDPEKEYFLDPTVARKMFEEVGFPTIPLLWKGKVKSYEQLEAFCQEHSPFASERREGVYIKVGDGKKVVNRFKMVRQDFKQGCNWNDVQLQKNKIVKQLEGLASGLSKEAIEVFKLGKEQQKEQRKVD